MKDTCKQAILRKDTRRANRAVNLWTAGDQDKGELEFFNKYLKFSLRCTMRNMFGMCSFAFWVISTQKCEAVNFLKFELASVTIRLFKYLGAPILLRACVPCMPVHNMHAYCDVTRFTYDVNHITMTSPVFTFHLCHVGMRWHDIIGVCIVGTPHHHGLHHMGMM